MINVPPLEQLQGQWSGKDGAEADAIRMEYQRRTQKGIGRREKTVHRGAAKNPRLLKACNITRQRDMGEFFFISVLDEICD
jgi:hypothetical protein